MMGFMYFFWGFLCQWALGFVTSAFSTSGLAGNWIDQVPLLVGYMLHWLGFMKLKPLNAAFGKGALGALVLMLLSIVQMLLPASSALTSQPWWGSLLTVIVILPEMYMIYYLCKGIGELAETRHLFKLKQIATRRWQLFIYCQVTIALALLTGLFANPAEPNAWGIVSGIFSIVYIVLNLIVYVLLLTFTWRTHKEMELAQAKV
ncbi:hypothetical protein [Paenibacillus campi]|uniref:hypothetical protein n=1 Tax=Paenibacillus campi TaxID=3106031 RepID=UPI002AFF31D8|nr:hypothetical protein [Paenibacillus sp. SGZ-1009]